MSQNTPVYRLCFTNDLGVNDGLIMVIDAVSDADAVALSEPLMIFDETHRASLWKDDVMIRQFLNDGHSHNVAALN